MVSEELRAIDADHFWIGEVMVDLNQLWYGAQRLTAVTARQSHSLVFNLQYLGHVAGCLARGDTEFLTPKNVVSALTALNQLGLHTGYTEKS